MQYLRMKREYCLWSEWVCNLIIRMCGDVDLRHTCP
jgi:hypothetical protein